MSTPELRDPRLDATYRDAPREEPPAALDARIRAAAHRAVDAGPQSLAAQTHRSWAARWRLPLSVAATALIAVTVSVMMRDQASIESRLETPAPAAPAPTVPAPPAPAGVETGARSRDQAPSPKREAPATAPATTAPVPAAAPPAARPSTREERARPGAALEAVPPSQPDRNRVRSEQPPAEAGDAAAAPAPSRPPEPWLEEIRRLRAAGREAEAAAELADFRRRYPDFALPPDLAR
jgi:hypothetical protein